MKKKTGLILVGLLLFITGAWFYARNFGFGPTFNGSRVSNPDSYQLSFTKMNMTDSHELALTEGDQLAVDFAIEKGKVNLLIGKEGQDPIYRGDDISSGVFRLDITESGTYTIRVEGKHAKGRIEIYANYDASK